MGPMSVRVASYFPFNVTCYLNGHSFVAQELTRAGVRFRKADNAFLGVADVDALQAAADRLSATVLQQRCSYWVRRVVPIFSPVERAALQPGYRYSMAQMELATDIVFKRSAPLKAMFQRACELGVLVGGAERTTHLFGRHITRRYQGKLQTVLDQREAGHPVLRWYYETSFAKQYMRGDHGFERCGAFEDDVSRQLHLSHAVAIARLQRGALERAEDRHHTPHPVAAALLQEGSAQAIGGCLESIHVGHTEKRIVGSS